MEKITYSYDFYNGLVTGENARIAFMVLNGGHQDMPPSTMDIRISNAKLYDVDIQSRQKMLESLLKDGWDIITSERSFSIYPQEADRFNRDEYEYEEYDGEQSGNYYSGELQPFSGDKDVAQRGCTEVLLSRRYYSQSAAVLSINAWSMEITYDSRHTAEAEADFRKLSVVFRSCYRKKGGNNIWQVGMSNGQFYLTPAKIEYDAEVPFEMLYPDKFMPVAANIDSFIKTDRAGMVILHGLQGSGKTSYIRKLVNDNREKQFVYLPAAMAQQLSSPEFVTFVHDQLKDSVMILEDCEQMLESRDSQFGNTGAISTLLNMSDGLLGDELSMKFICTFNAEIGRIDKALLRKGRLVDKYEFGKLDAQKAEKLAELVYGRPMGITTDMSLAEIFNMETDNHSQEPVRKKIGF